MTSCGYESIVLGVKVGARCSGDLMDHIVQKNSTDVTLGGFQPNQSYLVTGHSQWMIGEIHQTFGFYPIKEVCSGSLYSH